MEDGMWRTEVFDYWWLIPLILIALCIFWGRGCCFGRRAHIQDRPDRADETSSDSALEILGKRYARGEIDEEEYERKCRIITLAKKGEL
jgi:uncharacterized membrane protein